MFPLLLWLAAAAPRADAHGTDFISARLIQQADVITLRLGVDYLGNPMIPDEAAARAALEKALLVQRDDRAVPFTTLSKLKLETSSEWEDTLPASLQPADDGQPHLRMIGTWTWKADAERIRFQVEHGSRNDVLLWKAKADGGIESSLLLSGDSSPALVIPRPRSTWPLLAPLLVVGLLLQRWVKVRRGGS